MGLSLCHFGNRSTEIEKRSGTKINLESTYKIPETFCSTFFGLKSWTLLSVPLLKERRMSKFDESCD